MGETVSGGGGRSHLAQLYIHADIGLDRNEKEAFILAG